MITDLYRYPVKGLSGEALDRVQLNLEYGIAGDRMVAIARNAGALPAVTEGLPKNHFLMLMRDEALALLDCQFLQAKKELVIRREGTVVLKGSIEEVADRSRIEQFFREYLGDASLDPRVVYSQEHRFTDISRISDAKMRAISLINVNSVIALEHAIGEKIDLQRFRANVYFDGVPAWEELNWINETISIGRAKARVVMPTARCAATEVNPCTGERDLNIPKLIRQHFGHYHMGIYAEISHTGTVKIGDQTVALTDPPVVPEDER